MVDIPANTTTPASVAVGGSYSDLIEVSNDLDWIAVTLTAGTIIDIALNATGGDPIQDPFVALFDSAGIFIAEDDDSGAGLNSLLTYTVGTTGTYYIQAGTFGSGDTGGYTVTVTPSIPPPPQNPLDTITWGTEVANPAVSVYFATVGQTFDGVTSDGFNAYEISRFQAAFDLIEAVCGLTFDIVADAASAAFQLVLDTNENFNSILGYFNPPGEVNAGVGVFYGDNWDRAAGGDLEAGGYSMVTIVHELLHGLGLAHPHDTGGSSTIMNGVSSSFGDYGDFNLNQGIFTTMSYNTGFFTGTPGSQGAANNLFGYEYGPMALDIALLQQLYGVNTATNAGSTVYTLDTANAAGTYWQAIWDASGTDEIRHTGAAGSVIDLRSATLLSQAGGGGFVSAVNGIAGGFTIAAGAVIENARGGTGSDRITGNAAANLLDGGGGADHLDGGAGNDTLEGGLGNDTYIVDALGDVVQGEVAFGSGGGIDTVFTSVNFTAPTNVELVRAQTGAGNLSLTGNDAPGTLVGNEGANRLEGRGGNDQINGNAGNDTIIGGEGRDTLVGGAGADTFVFSSVSNSRAGSTNRDVLNGFTRAPADQDHIDLQAIDANTLTFGVDDAFSFIGTAAFAFGGASAGQLRLVSLGGPNAVIVEGDINGDRVADIQIFVNLQTVMVAGDFLL